jgi:hypothetical protein
MSVWQSDWTARSQPPWWSRRPGKIDKRSAVLMVQFRKGDGTPELAADSTKNLFKGTLVMVPGTYQQVDNTMYDLARIAVRTAATSKPLSETAP